MIVQGTPEWLEERRKRITATDIAAILGKSKWGTPLQKFNEKIYGTTRSQNEAMKRGLALEDEARRAFQDYRAQIIGLPYREFEPFFIKYEDWAAASLDGINFDVLEAVEIKCPGESDHALALQGEIPPEYMHQLQWQMYCTALNKIWYFSYRPQDVEPIALLTVLRDAIYLHETVPVARKFWENLQNKIPPELTDKDIVMRDDRPWLLLEEELLQLNELISMSEKRRDDIRAKMIEMCDGKSTQGFRVKLSPIPTRGAIDYSKIDALQGMDLEPYRKPVTIRWRVDKI